LNLKFYLSFPGIVARSEHVPYALFAKGNPSMITLTLRGVLVRCISNPRDCLS